MLGVSRTSIGALREQVTAAGADAGDEALRRVADELFALVHLLDDELRLRRAISDPGRPADQRAELISALLAGKVSPITEQVATSIARASWSRPGDVVDAADELAAQVLFMLAERHDALDDVEDELFRFARILDREPELRAALTDPGLPAERRLGLLEALVADKVRPVTDALIREVVAHPRGRTIDRGLDDYAALAAARRHRLVARVRSVVALTEEELTRLGDALAAQLGYRVHLNVEIDPDLVGGVSVLVGDQLFDGTIAHRIADARRLMTGS